MYQKQVSFGEAISRAFRNYCCFTGRASRSEFWWFILFSSILYCIVMGISISMNSSALETIAEDPDYINNSATASAMISLYTIPWIFSLAIFLPTLGLTFRRFHDSGHSGWWWLITFIPLVGIIVYFNFTLQPSQMFENKYGPIPNTEGDQLPPPYFRQ